MYVCVYVSEVVIMFICVYVCECVCVIFWSECYSLIWAAVGMWGVAYVCTHVFMYSCVMLWGECYSLVWAAVIMWVIMYVCIYACMWVCMCDVVRRMWFSHLNRCEHVSDYVCMYVCMAMLCIMLSNASCSVRFRFTHVYTLTHIQKCTIAVLFQNLTIKGAPSENKTQPYTYIQTYVCSHIMQSFSDVSCSAKFWPLKQPSENTYQYTQTHTHTYKYMYTHNAVLFGCFLLGEILTIKGAVGGMLIVGAALVASGIFKKPSDPTPKNA